MRKEVLVAIIVGTTLGLLVAFGVWRANKAIAPQQQVVAEKEVKIEEPLQDSLAVTEPESGVVVSEDKITVKGSAQPGSTVVLLFNAGQIILQPDEQGDFEQEVELEGGANEIRIISYDQEGNKQEKTVVVVYSTEFTGQ